MVWQALKYISYCATLTKNEIVDIYQKYLNRYKDGGDASGKILDFYGREDLEDVEPNSISSDQRIILVPANFCREGTPTVLWLQDRNVDIKCISVTPCLRNNEIFLDIDQPPSTGAYQICLGLKKQEEQAARDTLANRHILRQAFWRAAIPQLAARTGFYQSMSPTKDNWLDGATGHGSIRFNPVILFTGTRVELYIGAPAGTRTSGYTMRCTSKTMLWNLPLENLCIGRRYRKKTPPESL